MHNFTILGKLASKSNSRRLVAPGGRPMSIKSAAAMEFEEGAIPQIPADLKGLGLGSKNQLLGLSATIYYPSFRSDLDDTLLCDVLERAGVVSNDRWIREKRLLARVDKDNPRVEVRLWEL